MLVARFEVSQGDARYPPQLRLTPDPPQVLYGRGDPAALVEGVAIIGARRATPYGTEITHIMASWAARAGYTVVSGGATGCDQAAHRAALEANGTTVAVMGCGADVPYPRSAASLFDEIAHTDGAVVSEYPWGTEPRPYMFRRRNRIIAGLSAGVLVVEAGLPSGTFSTADEALSAGRLVMAVPGSVLSPHSRGSNRLIRQGATPVTDVSDLRDELASVLGPARTDDVRSLGIETAGHDALLAALLANPMRPDDVARALGLDVVTVSRRIGRLEASGLVIRYPDGTYGARAKR